MLCYLSKETRNTEYTTSKVQKCNFVPSFSGLGVVIQVCQAWLHEWNLACPRSKGGDIYVCSTKVKPDRPTPKKWASKKPVSHRMKAFYSSLEFKNITQEAKMCLFFQKIHKRFLRDSCLCRCVWCICLYVCECGLMGTKVCVYDGQRTTLGVEPCLPLVWVRVCCSLLYAMLADPEVPGSLLSPPSSFQRMGLWMHATTAGFIWVLGIQIQVLRFS